MALNYLKMLTNSDLLLIVIMFCLMLIFVSLIFVMYVRHKLSMKQNFNTKKKNMFILSTGYFRTELSSSF